ncbi:MAG: N-acetylmuramic acid 6-phosphate etherase, partial [Microcoleaceae cyanobacterium]
SVMVKLGKVYGNRMVDVSVKNDKLRDRAIRIIRDLTDLSGEESAALLIASQDSVKLALMMHWTGLNRAESETLLAKYQGNLRQAVDSQKS